MEQQELTEEQKRRCVFLQRYRKIGPDQFVRKKPEMDITLPGDDLPERYRDPIITPDAASLDELPAGSEVQVRVYDEKAISPYGTRGRFERGDLLEDITDAQTRCDDALKATGGLILDDLSRY